MKLSKAEVGHIAWLARLELSETEMESFPGHMNQILAHFEELQKLDTGQAEPTSHSIPVQNVYRDDILGESMATEDVLANAPDRTDEYFVVPQIVEM